MLLIPAFVIVTLFFLAPLIDVFVRSVTDPQPGLQNYVWLFTTKANLNVVLRTFVTAIIVVKTFIDFVTRRGFSFFAWWRVIVGSLGLIALALGY